MTHTLNGQNAQNFSSSFRWRNKHLILATTATRHWWYRFLVFNFMFAWFFRWTKQTNRQTSRRTDKSSDLNAYRIEYRKCYKSVHRWKQRETNKVKHGGKFDEIYRRNKTKIHLKHLAPYVWCVCVIYWSIWANTQKSQRKHNRTNSFKVLPVRAIQQSRTNWLIEFKQTYIYNKTFGKLKWP